MPNGVPVRRDRGLTLVELVVSMGLMMLVLAFSARLFSEAGRAFQVAGRKATEPAPGWAVEQLRNDLREASVAGTGPPGLWRSDPLLLAFPAAEPVRWRLDDDGFLLRERESSLGWLSRRQIAGVASFRWQRRPGGLVEVAVLYRHRGVPWGPQITAPLPRAPAEELETLRLLVALRGAGRSAGW